MKNKMQPMYESRSESINKRLAHILGEGAANVSFSDVSELSEEYMNSFRDRNYIRN